MNDNDSAESNSDSHLPDDDPSSSSQQMDAEIFVCDICDRRLRSLASLHQHLRMIHRVGVDGRELSPSKKKKKKFSCSECRWEFTSRANLIRHQKNIHPKDNDEQYRCGYCDFKTTVMYYLKRHIQKHDNEKAKPKVLKQCDYCEEKFDGSERLKNHVKKIHTKKFDYHKKCPECSFVSTKKTRDEIFFHFREVHNVPIRWESLTFDSLEAFKEWINSSTVQYKSINSSYYVCNRSGNDKKVGAYCPSAISVKVKDNGHVNVQYMPCHVGHEGEMTRHVDTKQKRPRIGAGQLQNRTRPEDSSMSGGIGKTSLTNKTDLHSIIKQDLDNIKKTFDVKTVKSDNDWVRKLKTYTNTSLFYFKPQGAVSDDFQDLTVDECLLIYMSNAQKSILRAFGNNIICIDSACSLNDDYNLKLFTISVIDSKSRQSLPVAFMFTNRNKCLDDDLVMSIFFQKIKRLTGCLVPNVFVSGIEETVYATWCKVMGPPKRRIFSTTHVLEAWHDSLARIQSEDRRENVLIVLKILLYKFDRADFHKLLEDFVKDLMSNNETREYYRYFQSEFVENMRYKNWAHCYLDGLDIFNVLFENFQKQCCTRVKKLRNFDEILSVVLSFSHEKIFDWSVGMEQNNIKNKLNILMDRHKLSLFTSDTSLFTKITDDTWKVMSLTGKELFTVKKVENCSKCQLLCTPCKSCWHEFVCTCNDFLKANNMCVHIHSVARSLVDPLHEDTLKDSSVSEFDRLVSQDDTQGVAENVEEDVIIEGIFQDDEIIDESHPNEVCAEKEGVVLHYAVGFIEKLQKFVDYCQHGAKSREQIAYLEKIMEQAMRTADTLGKKQ